MSSIFSTQNLHTFLRRKNLRPPPPPSRGPPGPRPGPPNRGRSPPGRGPCGRSPDGACCSGALVSSAITLLEIRGWLPLGNNQQSLIVAGGSHRCLATVI